MGDKFTADRTKTIMKTSSDTNKVNKEATMITAYASEMFLKQLVQDVVNEAKTSEINYKNVADVVHAQKKYDFLRVIIPQKITVKEYKLLLEKSAESLSDYEANDTDNNISSGSEQYYGDDEIESDIFDDE